MPRYRGIRPTAVLWSLATMVFATTAVSGTAWPDDVQVTETDREIRLVTPQLEAAIRKRGYVSGVAGESFLDRKTGFRDAGFGLDIVDWIMEPGSDEAYRDQLDKELVYQFGNYLPRQDAEALHRRPADLHAGQASWTPRSSAGGTSRQ